MRSRRQILSKQCYEICFRARSGLPFVAYGVIKLLIASILARVQRDEKVILCHDIWNGSHCHLIVVSQDSEAFTRFYGELQKKITDALKRLLGKKYLNIWEDRTSVIHIADAEMAKDRIAYLYANPAQDNLVDCIDQFPGYSSWIEFNICKNSLNAENISSLPWIRLTTIPRLKTPYLTPEQDYQLVHSLTARNTEDTHKLKRQPNAWMRCFGVFSNIEVESINREIIEKIRYKEARARSAREKNHSCVLGAHKLSTQRILAPHEPKKKDRKIFLLCSAKKIRIRLLKMFKDFCEECRICYLKWKSGDFSVTWPPGAFKPPLPPAYNFI